MARTKFFCDNCGTEVPKESESCPVCGRSFSSVRCPVCGFVGEASFFDNGCPTCGYSTFEEKKPLVNTNEPVVQTTPNIPPNDYIWSLPIWVYIVTGIAVLAVCIAMYLKL